MTDDTFTLYALGLTVDRPTFEALLADHERWGEYLKACRKRGPSVPRTIAAHRGSAWHLVSSNGQVYAQETGFLPEPVSEHPIVALLGSLGSQASTEERSKLLTIETYRFSREKPILNDLIQSGAFVRKLSAKKSRSYRQALYEGVAGAFKDRVVDLLAAIFKVKDGKVVYATRRGHVLPEIGGTARLQYEEGDPMPVAGKVFLSIEPVKFEGFALTDAVEILRLVSPPDFVELERNPASQGFHLTMKEESARKILEEGKK